jgi:hypothetical protein
MQLYNTTTVCLGLAGRGKHTHTTRRPDPAGSDVDSRRGSSTLGINYTFSGV